MISNIWIQVDIWFICPSLGYDEAAVILSMQIDWILRTGSKLKSGGEPRSNVAARDAEPAGGLEVRFGGHYGFPPKPRETKMCETVCDSCKYLWSNVGCNSRLRKNVLEKRELKRQEAFL